MFHFSNIFLSLQDDDHSLESDSGPGSVISISDSQDDSKNESAATKGTDDNQSGEVKNVQNASNDGNIRSIDKLQLFIFTCTFCCEVFSCLLFYIFTMAMIVNDKFTSYFHKGIDNQDGYGATSVINISNSQNDPDVSAPKITANMESSKVNDTRDDDSVDGFGSITN